MNNNYDINIGDIYYHYKHNPKESINNFAYEVIGVAIETETEKTLVIYKPLYECKHKLFARPIELFTGTVNQGTRIIPRFSPIIDKDTLEALRKLSALET